VGLLSTLEKGVGALARYTLGGGFLDRSQRPDQLPLKPCTSRRWCCGAALRWVGAAGCALGDVAWRQAGSPLAGVLYGTGMVSPTAGLRVAAQGWEGIADLIDIWKQQRTFATHVAGGRVGQLAAQIATAVRTGGARSHAASVFFRPGR